MIGTMIKVKMIKAKTLLASTVLFGLLPVLLSMTAQAAYRTDNIDKWGYQKDKLVLMMKSGKTVFVAPSKCSTDDFNRAFDGFADIDLRISKAHLKRNTDFTVSSVQDGRKNIVRCAVKTLSE